MLVFDRTITSILKERLLAIEDYLKTDVIFYFGEIHPSYDRLFRDFIEELKETDPDYKKLTIILNTPGGSAEAVEKIVGIIRHHYKEIHFIVPDYAMSAGTIFCMSGDKILMDYSSSLGPIDPQVFNGSHYVPALGYLDKVEELIEKDRNGTLTKAEFVILQNQDLGTLRSYEQAKDLSMSLLKEWLVKYKFKDWTHHRTDKVKKEQKVTLEEKQQRAEEIAAQLANNKHWHSHGRMIGIKTLTGFLRLEIEDYSLNPTLRELIRNYNDLLTEYISEKNFRVFLHSKNST